MADPQLDKFAKTFVAKADSRKLWDTCLGIWDTGHEDHEILAGAIIVSIGKRKPTMANLQLLHTFSEYRRLGLAGILSTMAYEQAYAQNAEYFRVSSEPESVGFYESLGLRFWGPQKSGSLLCVHKITGRDMASGVYDKEDRIISRAIKPGAIGGLRLGEEPRDI